MATVPFNRFLGAATDEVKTQEQNLLVPEQFDHIDISYTNENPTTVVYRQGGPAGAVVATLTLSYVGELLVSVTRT